MFSARQLFLESLKTWRSPEPVTQIQNLWRAIVTVGAKENLRLGPMFADLADQAANVDFTLSALGVPGRAQHRSDEPAVPVEDDDGLEAIFAVKRIEQAQLLIEGHLDF